MSNDGASNFFVWLWHHPEADAPDDACLGWLDPPLRDRPRTRELAQALAQRIRTPGPDGIFGGISGVWSSDLRRARQAARPLARALRVTHHQTPALRDASFGVWEGRLWKDIAREDPTHYENYNKRWAKMAMPGGESWGQVQGRVARWWKELGELPGGRVIVGHGASLRAIAAVICDWTPEEAITMSLARGHFACLDRQGMRPPTWNLHPESPLGRHRLETL